MMGFFESITDLFTRNIVGDPVFSAVIFLVLLATLLVLAETPTDNILAFLILPIYALNTSGHLSGVVAGSVWILIVIFSGFVLFKSIIKLTGSR